MYVARSRSRLRKMGAPSPWRLSWSPNLQAVGWRLGSGPDPRSGRPRVQTLVLPVSDTNEASRMSGYYGGL